MFWGSSHLVTPAKSANADFEDRKHPHDIIEECSAVHNVHETKWCESREFGRAHGETSERMQIKLIAHKGRI